MSGSGLRGPLTAPPIHSLLSLHPVGWLSLGAAACPSSLPASPLWGLACLRGAPPRRGGHAVLRALQGSCMCRLQPPGAPGKRDFPGRPRAWCSARSLPSGPQTSLSRLPHLAPHFSSPSRGPWQAPRPEATPVRGWGGQRPQAGRRERTKVLEPWQ